MRHPWDQRLGVWWIAEDRPGLPAIVDAPSGQTLTFGELAGRAHQLVHALHSRDIGAGDVVAYALPNDVDILVWQLATSEAGMRSLALNPALSGEEMRAIVDHSDAAAVAVDAGYAARVDELAAPASIKLRVAAGGSIPEFLDQAELLAGHPTTLPDDRLFGSPISYSSGTTGQPKAIWRPQRRADPSVVADAMKSFGHAFRFMPFEGPHLVTAGMHHGGCQGFTSGR